jgi:signal transduction histidine kinase/CheY-like chemotaxis protein
VTIRKRLFLLVAGAFFPLMIFSVAVTSFSWWQQRNGVELRYLERVRAVTLALDDEIDESIRMLRAVGEEAGTEPAGQDALANRLRRALYASPLWSAAAIGDPEWKQVAASVRGGDMPAPSADRVTLERAIETGVPQVSGLIPTRTGGYQTQVLVPAGGRVLLATIDADSWLEFISQYAIDPDAAMTLVDQHGVTIARSPDDERWVGKPPAPLVMEKSAAMPDGAYRGTGPEGEAYYGAHSRSQRWGWTVAAGIPAAVIEAALLKSSLFLAAAAFLTIMLAALLAFHFGRRIQLAIAGLGAAARALAHAEPLPPRPPRGIDEVDAVRQAFEESDAKLRERQEALNQALAAEREARQEAEQANRSKDEFLAMLGHELRNPLNAIQGAMGVLHRVDPQGGEAQHARDVIDRQMVSLRDLVDDLLDVARVTRGRIVLDARPIDLANAARRTMMMLSASGRLGRHRIHTDCREAWVRGDETRLEQIVTNLVENAVKYTPAGGEVTVRVRSRDGRALLEVEDSGIGIAPELLPRIFDLFTQGERTLDRAQGGLGLGLALVRRLVELHSGTIEAASAGSGKGARFTVALPAIPAAVTPEGDPHRAGSQRGRMLHILVVEDNEDGRETLAMMLRIGGHHVDEADSGPGGLASLKALHPDIAIVDIGLPGFDGYEVARRTRATPDISATRLVALTGYGQDDDRRNARAAGFDWFLVKPANMDALEDILAHL